MLEFLRSKTLSSLLLCGTAMSMAVFADAGVAHAQQNQLEEVIVTARRTEERLQDVPIAVSAFTEERLEKLNITDAGKLSNYTPGFEFNDYAGGRSGRGSLRTMVMRGLFLSNNSLLNAAALVFQDGAPVLSGEVLITDGIQRVEVLKGPQNVYFGRSTFAGAINYVTKNPGNDYRASITADIGNFDYHKVEVHAEGAIIRDKLTMSIDGQYMERDGQYTNAFQPSQKFGARNTQSIAATLYFTPTEDLSIKVFGNYYEYKDGPGAAIVYPSALAATCNPGGTLGRVGGVITGALGPNFFPCGTNFFPPGSIIGSSTVFTDTIRTALDMPHPGFGGRLVDCDGLEGLCTRNYTLHSILNYDNLPGGFSFSGIAAYHNRPVGDYSDSIQGAGDTTQRPNPLFGTTPTAPRFITSAYYIQNITEDWSVEGRLSSDQSKKIRGTFGANYVHATNTGQLYFFTNAGAAASPALPYNNSRLRANTIGVFGGLYVEPIKGLIFSAEGRYQEDDIVSLATSGRIFAKKYYANTPRVSVTYQANENLNIYASYAEGVRPGGFNASLVTLPQRILTVINQQIGSAPIAFDQEKIWQAEAGVKGSFLDRRVQTNIAVYTGRVTDWQQAQSAFLVPSDPQFGGRFDLTANTGSIKLTGIEADGQWLVNDLLTLSGTFAYTDTAIEGSNSFVAFTYIGRTSVDGNRLPFTPKYAFTVAADLGDDLGRGDLRWFAHADVVYKGNRWFDQTNLLGTGRSTLVNAQIGVENDRWSAMIWGSNILNDKHLTGGAVSSDSLSGSTTTIRAALSDKPMYGLRFKYNFGS